jgi:2',3'-cyclic-nucleotide 2'-phosphodiesterase/3'-nucleotidase
MKKCFLIYFLVIALLFCGCGVATEVNQTEPCVTHVDYNKDGSCDWCDQSVMITFDFYSINDLHGKLADGENHPGVDELSTYFEMARLRDDNVIILSAGDMWQGSAESNLTYGAIITDWMNDVGFTAMTLGNHEFDWGEAYIRQNEQIAKFPFLAINVYERGTNTRVDYCESSVVVDASGIQIGIIGSVADYDSIAPDKVEDIYFKTGAELTSLVKKESERLRGEGVDFVVYVLHDGYGSSVGTGGTVVSSSQIKSYYDVALSDGYVDLVFEGHTHQGYVFMDEYGVIHLQNRGDNKGGISHVEVAFNTMSGSFSVNTKDLVSTDVYGSLFDDPIVHELLEKYKDEIAIANQVIGQNKYKRNSTYLRQTVAQLYYELGVEEWGSEYEITLGGGFLQTRSPYDLPAGEVKYGQLQSLLPFDNDLVLCSIKGSDLLNRFINTDNSNYYISGDAALMSSVEPDGTYYVVVDNYTSSYEPNRLTVVEEFVSGIYARDLLAEYISEGGFSK